MDPSNFSGVCRAWSAESESRGFPQQEPLRPIGSRRSPNLTGPYGEQIRKPRSHHAGCRHMRTHPGAASSFLCPEAVGKGSAGRRAASGCYRYTQTLHASVVVTKLTYKHTPDSTGLRGCAQGLCRFHGLLGVGQRGAGQRLGAVAGLGSALEALAGRTRCDGVGQSRSAIVPRMHFYL